MILEQTTLKALIKKILSIQDEGEIYYCRLERVKPKEKLRRTFHALCREFFKTGMYSYDIRTWQELKGVYKRSIRGVRGYSVEKEGWKKLFEYYYEIPDRLKHLAKEELWPWEDLSLKECSECVSLLIADINTCQAWSEKIEQIYKGMGV